MLQYGVEVIGGDRRSEDLRVLFTAFETLSLCGGDYKIEIGHAQFFDALIDTLELSADEKKAVKAYLAAKNSSMMPFGVSGGNPALDIARRLPRLCGGAEVLEESRRLAGGSGRAAEIVDYVESVYNAFIESGYADRIIIDMGIVQRIEYYTGIVFKGLYRRHRRAGCFRAAATTSFIPASAAKKNRLRLRTGRVRRRRIARRVP